MTAIGLLGGSFNPAHRGHRAISLSVIDAVSLDEMWWLVSPGNPLKPAKGMAPLAARLASARKQARRAPIRPTAIEAALGTRYTADTLSRLTRRYPRHRFIWVMGADNLAQFHRWKDWRRIAHIMPIAVVGRPGYNASAVAAPAMAWFRRYVRRPGQAKNWTNWSRPALVFLRFPPDQSSATALRGAYPDWHLQYSKSNPRDAVTRQHVRRISVNKGANKGTIVD